MDTDLTKLTDEQLKEELKRREDAAKPQCPDAKAFKDVDFISSTVLFVIAKPPENIMAILEGLIELHNKVYSEALEYKDVFKPVATYTKEAFAADEAQQDQWDKDYIALTGKKPDYDTYWGYEKQENVGRTLIEGAGDNTIPSWMFGAIEGMMGNYVYGVERFHLG